MPKLKFTATKTLTVYNGPTGSCGDGDTIEVSEANEERLLRDFPQNFMKVGTEPKPNKPVVDEKAVTGKQNKAV